jgi:hypothetical protein
VIAIAVTVITKGATTKFFASMFQALGASATTAAAAATVASTVTAAAAGSIVSQTVGVATGIQEKFSWKQVALAARDSLQSGGNSTYSSVLKTMLVAAARSAVKQGMGVVTGMQDKFSWAAVAAAGVSAGVDQVVGGGLGRAGITGRAAQYITSGATALARAATMSLIDGTDFGDNVRAELPSVIAPMIFDGLVAAGTMIGEALSRPPSEVPLTAAQMATNQAAAASDIYAAKLGLPDGTRFIEIPPDESAGTTSTELSTTTGRNGEEIIIVTAPRKRGRWDAIGDFFGADGKLGNSGTNWKWRDGRRPATAVPDEQVIVVQAENSSMMLGLSNALHAARHPARDFNAFKIEEATIASGSSQRTWMNSEDPIGSSLNWEAMLDAKFNLGLSNLTTEIVDSSVRTQQDVIVNSIGEGALAKVGGKYLPKLFAGTALVDGVPLRGGAVMNMPTMTVDGLPIRYDIPKLYHYTNDAGMTSILNSKQLNPSRWQAGTKEVRYGEGQYLTDIVPGTRSSASIARELVGIPNKYKFTNYVAVDTMGLPVVIGRKGVFVVRGNAPLDISTRMIASGRTQ